jgi:hypothetical protein
MPENLNPQGGDTKDEVCVLQFSYSIHNLLRSEVRLVRFTQRLYRAE